MYRRTVWGNTQIWNFNKISAVMRPSLCFVLIYLNDTLLKLNWQLWPASSFALTTPRDAESLPVAAN
jgi:hypothetical protein